MPKKRYRPEEIIGKLREADVLISQGKKGKLLSPSRRRACVKAVCEGLNVTERRACKVLGQYRSTQRHVARVKSDEDALSSAIVELAGQYGRYGYRLLNRELFYTLKEARILIEQWRRHYNGVRPHSALGYRPPAPETIAFPGIGLPSPWNSMETAAGFLH